MQEKTCIIEKGPGKIMCMRLTWKNKQTCIDHGRPRPLLQLHAMAAPTYGCWIRGMLASMPMVRLLATRIIYDDSTLTWLRARHHGMPRKQVPYRHSGHRW